MAARSIGICKVAVCLAWFSQFADAQDFAQLDCAAARRLYDEAHDAQGVGDHHRALQAIQTIKSKVPRQCRLESDEQLARYEINLKNLVSQQGREIPSSRCKPVQTGPYSYSC
jgi:hypothetical protein